MADQSSTPFDQGLFLVHLNRGREHFDQRNFIDAADQLEEARRLRPDDDSVLNLLGIAYFKQEKYKESDGVYRKLIELNPESYTLHFNLGLVCFKMSNLDNAEAIFLRALELKPDNQKTHFYLGNIYEKKGQYYNSIFQYRKAGANIMVKRVQEKIDLERPSDQAETAERAARTMQGPANPDETNPPRAISGVMADMGTATTGGMQAPDTLEKINVDHIDRHRFLNALQAGLFKARPPQDPGTVSDETSPNLEIGGLTPPTTKVMETQEEILSAEDQAGLTETLDRIAPNDETVLAAETIPSSKGTRLRLTEPLVPDQSLEEAAEKKVPEQAGSELFSDGRHDRHGSALSAHIPPAQPVSIGEPDAQGHPQHIAWRTAGHEHESRVHSQMRRRDDTFRYLENNLMEVNFSGKVFIKQGTIYSYSGNLTFWVKPQREETAPALVIVSGTGKLLLTDRQRDITVLQIDDEEIFVEPSHLLACEETLTPQYAVIEKTDDDPSGGMHVLMIKGTGLIALSVATSPLIMTVQEDYPVNVSSASLISWSGNLRPTLVQDEALAEILQPGPEAGVNLRLAGDGKVMMEKSAPR
ncbi:MAG: tetratricopeptide repeat protein [Acidobacteria bacterium]|nr:MAG: tetratricopeptide repeat protein [Acidobacteriota bacterium]